MAACRTPLPGWPCTTGFPPRRRRPRLPPLDGSCRRRPRRQCRANELVRACFGREAHDELFAQKNCWHAHTARPLRLRYFLQPSERRRILANVAYRDPELRSFLAERGQECLGRGAMRTALAHEYLDIDGLRRGLSCVRKRGEGALAERNAGPRQCRCHDQQHRPSIQKPPGDFVQHRSPTDLCISGTTDGIARGLQGSMPWRS